MPLNVKKISSSVVCPNYVPIVKQKLIMHNKLLKQWHNELTNKGFICIEEVNIVGDFAGYEVHGRIDMLCFDHKTDTIHIYEVKSVSKCHLSYILQSLLYGILLIRNTQDISWIRNITIHIACKDHEVHFRLDNCPIKYIVTLLKALDKLTNNIKSVGPWCKYCRNKWSCSAVKFSKLT